tara:strand:- start:52 stop:438 length:387 start_codon:yes stop_codon:yes gene_type:complete
MEVQPLFYTNLPKDCVYYIYDKLVYNRRLPLAFKCELLITSHFKYTVYLHKINETLLVLKVLLIWLLSNQENDIDEEIFYKKLYKKYPEKITKEYVHTLLTEEEYIENVIKELWSLMDIDDKIRFITL